MTRGSGNCEGMQLPVDSVNSGRIKAAYHLGELLGLPKRIKIPSGRNLHYHWLALPDEIDDVGQSSTASAVPQHQSVSGIAVTNLEEMKL